MQKMIKIYELVKTLLPSMLEGMSTSLMIFLLTLLISLPLGLLVCSGRMSRYRIIRYPVQLYLLIMRGTPLMLQLFFFYYGPYYIFRMSSPDRFFAAIITFGLNYTAYFAEIYRSGFEGIPKGQYEAASALGFTKAQTLFKIILPQVVKRIIPPMGSEFMTLVKDTALAKVLSVSELFMIAEKAASSNVSIIPYVMAAIFYLVMNFIVGQGFLVAEKKLDYYR